MKAPINLQSLNPSGARLCLKIRKIFASAMPGARKALLSISGGPDSLALGHIMSVIAPSLNLTLAAMHIDHSLRPSSTFEADFVREHCESVLKIPCAVARANVMGMATARHCGLEEAGRIIRHDLLEAHARDIGADVILLGHHAEDLAEDIFLRLIRGAGWPALSGMRARNGHFFRPLLNESPESLKDFLRDLEISWVNDASNQSLAFRRNRIRHLLMPMLRCENPAITRSLARLHDLGAIDAEYFERELDAALTTTPWQVTKTPGAVELLLPQELLESMPKALRLRLYHRAIKFLRQASKADGQTRADALFNLDDLWLSGVGGKIVQCGGGVTARPRKGAIGLTFERRQEKLP